MTKKRNIGEELREGIRAIKRGEGRRFHRGKTPFTTLGGTVKPGATTDETIAAMKEARRGK